ncbi:hypothetical protein PUNSTDRAFT_137791 [Punctularia strigosozonata HHB-11173 SS5]|uniref:Uncharacterized protein n=1 Tax=Punctularia strigosozonata (strain HHB-11173) TaxID=741275 RepID=R7S3Z3_PUNST|nr:uncharacterized protein PUNSTDRAFT_137791 [Punctularia strigosozonata HHB-11173 SS5]EIN05105.1 hypothetical protein PUNSTDRAFT_137791 [Punctularia strigosozonata HHB-11173 SS5]
MDCPLLVWMLSLSRDVTREEYDECYKLVKECIPGAPEIKHAPDSNESLRQVLCQMMPLLMMRHRRVPRAQWRDRVTPNGKHWIEQDPSGMHPEKYLRSMIGYTTASEGSLVAMSMVQGRQREVVNVGLGMRMIAPEPRDAPVAAYVESQAHKLTEFELGFLRGEPDEVALRRLCILLSLKGAYIQAIGQPLGFDWSRLEFNIPTQAARGDGHPLTGWEFRVFRAELGVVREGELVPESYQCATAFFRGTSESKFVWQENQKEIESWVQFLNIEQMIKVIPKLSA